MNNPTLLLGAPGTGKTQRLIDIVVDRKANSFTFLSFTRRAANEAKERLSMYFTPQQLQYVRTIHSLCFELGHLSKEQVMTEQHIYKFANEYGYELHPRRFSQEDGSIYTLSEDDVTFQQMKINMARMEVEQVEDNPMWPAYASYMHSNGLIDYHQMLLEGIKAIRDKLDVPVFDLLLVDEFQDLSQLQLFFLACLGSHCRDIVYAGDPNQMIFEWAGVDRKDFLNAMKYCQIESLYKNYRLPISIANLAQRIAQKQMDPLAPVMHLTNGEDGSVEYMLNDEDFVLKDEGSYLFLARNNYLLKNIIEILDWGSNDWSWLDDDKKTQIKLSTIHGAKGAEADNVILYTDVSPATAEHLDDDAEHRVWYVAVTRARKKLYILQPRGNDFYDLE